ncbi:MAG: sensor histidine kinase [Acidimicrobiia bacterium]
MSNIADALRALPYFADLPDKLILSVCEGSETVDVEAGTVIIEEGSDSVEMYVVVEGEMTVTKHTADTEVELARVGPGEVVGEMALLDNSPRMATVRAAEKSQLIRVPVEAFEHLLEDSRVVRRMFRTVTARLRDIEDKIRHEERMAALGRMAAQLMHELNNPAAAVARSTQELLRTYAELGDESRALVGVADDDYGLIPPQGDLSTIQRSESEEAVAGWLIGHGVSGAWDIAPAMVQAGWTPERLDKATSILDSERLARFARWVGLRATAEQLIGEIAIGAGRISELVRVVKDYSYLDRGPIQEIVPTSGIRDTLILLKHKLRGIEVELDFEDDLATVEVSGRDLNQVWTNLIDNAADAMGESGTITIRAHNQDRAVVVSVADTGPGIPDDVAARIFDPFYTTKEPGKGTGLGLHTVHTILKRANADIEVASSPQGTTFTVTLPTLGSGDRDAEPPRGQRE